MPVFKGKTLAQIDVDSWAKEIADTRIESTGRKFFVVMKEMGFEIPKVKFLDKGKRFDETQVLEEEEVLNVIDNFVNPKYKAICRISAYSGLRLGDVLGLRKSEIDFSEGITRKQNKTGKPVFCPMTPKLKNALLSVPEPLRERDKWLAPVSSEAVSKAASRAFTKAGIPWATFHHFRHFVACHLVNNGVGIEMVQKILGHQDIRHTLIYARIKRDTIKEAMAVLGGR